MQRPRRNTASMFASYGFLGQLSFSFLLSSLSLLPSLPFFLFFLSFYPPFYISSFPSPSLSPPAPPPFETGFLCVTFAVPEVAL